jgi:hypothetical protein
MLYVISRELEYALKAQHVPFPVVFGPERAEEVASSRERIVVEYRGAGGDSYGPPKQMHANPRMAATCKEGARLRIFARSNLTGATWHDHAERAKRVAHHIIAELIPVVRMRKCEIALGAGGFVELGDTAGSATQSAAVYELVFEIECAVYRRTWEGDKRPEATLGQGGLRITSTTKVSDKLGPAGTPPVDAEPAC